MHVQMSTHEVCVSQNKTQTCERGHKHARVQAAEVA
jgi:hypothetical protein